MPKFIPSRIIGHCGTCDRIVEMHGRSSFGCNFTELMCSALMIIVPDIYYMGYNHKDEYNGVFFDENGNFIFPEGCPYKDSEFEDVPEWLEKTLREANQESCGE
jgi:hypothetical protein